MSLSYVHEPERWAKLAAVLREVGAFGLDTEYYTLDGTDPREMTTWGRVRIHVWSVSVFVEDDEGGEYHTATLPVEALSDPALRGVLEDEAVTKYLHNAPVDVHAFANHGVTVR